MASDIDHPVLSVPKRRRDAHKRTRLGSVNFPIGIEEEYFLADAATLDVAARTPDTLFKPRPHEEEAVVGREFLQCQVEVTTRPHADIGKAAKELYGLRQTAAERAGKHGLAILACGTHPTGKWHQSVQTPKPRYDEVMADLQMIGQRNMLCGMHVHVELPDSARRVEIMTRLIPYTPLLLALSTSSPFWQGRDSGLKGYRLAAYDELPRTGLPELFKSNEDYEAYVDAMVRSGVIPDSSHLWWAIRLSRRYPTLELRAPDCCTRTEDAVAIAALYRCLVRHLYLDRVGAEVVDVVTRSLAVENKWRAQRYGVAGSFATEFGGIAVGDFLDQVLRDIRLDADALGCVVEVERCRQIVAKGTAADAQLAIFETFEDPAAGLNHVTRWIADTTLAR